MPTAVPAMRGRIGTTEYFITTFKAGELVQKLTIPKELEGWEDLSLEERFQREINYKRVKDHIAPYLVDDPDRFFGALIVDIYNGDSVEFEPLPSIATLPGLYKQAAQAFGFLNFTGGEVLVPLDGQHRLMALKFAISGKDQKGNDISGLQSDTSLANEDVTVMLVKHDLVKARKIFNKVNRYAKATTKADNLITADDDIVAVLSRAIADELIGSRLVNFSSNTLPKKSEHFTTLGTVYDATDLLLADHNIDKTTLPDLAKQKLLRELALKTWDLLLKRIDLWHAAVMDKEESGDAKRMEIRKDTLLGKPIAQLSLVDAFKRLRDVAKDGGSAISDDEICRRLNSLDWRVINPAWQRVLMNGAKVATGRQAASFAGEFIAYLVGMPMSVDQLSRLEQRYRTLFPPEEQPSVHLPPRA